MISVVDITPGQGGRMVLEPSDSLLQQGNLGFFVSILVVSLCISVAFVFAGAWLMAPFVVLQGMFLFALTYYAKYQQEVIEVISVDSESITVEKGRRRAEDSWCFSRYQARVLVDITDDPIDNYSVSLSGEQGMLLLGDALSQSDCDELVASLKECGLRVNEPGSAVIFTA